MTLTPVQARCTIALELLVGARHVPPDADLLAAAGLPARAVNRFQRVAGFDRAVALASSAVTALIPLAILAGSVQSAVGRQDRRAADRGG